MKQYYYSNSKEQFGPFSLDDLKKQNINKETWIWYDGLDDWKKASEIEELKDVLNSAPPPIKTNNNQHSNSSKQSMSILRKVSIFIGVVLLFGLIYLAINNKTEKQELTEEELKIELSKKEMLDPIKHLSVLFESEYSTYGRNYDIKGEISNNALACKYKDVVLIVKYFSKSDKEIGREEFTIFEYIDQGSSIGFKIEPTAPKQTVKIDIEIKSATPI